MKRTLYFFMVLGLILISVVALLPACSSAATSTTTAPPTSTTPAPTTSSTTPPTTTSTPPPTSTTAALTVNVSSNAKLGSYLVDGKGMTLYYFVRDTLGKSTTTGTVAANWPLFNPPSFVVPPTLNAADFNTITRDDGQKEATYKGWPLYTFVNDKAPGDTLGDGVGGIWFAVKVPFYTVLLQSKTDLGIYLADAKGMTLYYFTKDSVGKSTAAGAVLANWPLFNPASFIIPSTLNAADFGSITRDDGAKVATYKGWPLYYFINDKAPGDTLGQGVGGVWFVVTPANFPPTPTPTTTTPAPTTTTATPTPTPTPTPSPTATPPVPTPTPYSIAIQNFTFSPTTITIFRGSSVTWKNNDSAAHTVTSDGGYFNGSLNAGGTFTFTFTTPGSFPYHCAIHTYMTGTIIVQ